MGYTTSCLHVPLPQLDCGTGAPLALSYSTLPFRSPNGLLFGSVAPGPGGDGVLLLLAAGGAEAAMLADSGGEALRALQGLVPGARVLLPRLMTAEGECEQSSGDDEHGGDDRVSAERSNSCAGIEEGRSSANSFSGASPLAVV